MPYKDPEVRKIKSRERVAKHYKKHPEKCIAAVLASRAKNPEAYLRAQARFKMNHPGYAKMKNAEPKRLVVEAYGGHCVCCGEDRFEFLTIDHIFNDGRVHRAEARTNRGGGLYTWLRKHGFPKDRYRLLCMNCNFAKGKYGYCPHEREPEYGIQPAC